MQLTMRHAAQHLLVCGTDPEVRDANRSISVMADGGLSPRKQGE